jgi:predicted CXXCH cytochrome family protein
LTGHPIGIAYPIADPRYHPVASLSAPDSRIPLPDGRVQCISCHDPHNTGRHPAMLVRSNRGSGLCLSCHRL